MKNNKNDIKTLEDIENEFSKLYTWFVFTFILFAMLAFGFILVTFKLNKIYQKVNDNSVQAGAFYNNDIDSYVITDLTGTSWVINSTTCYAGYGQFDLEYYFNTNTETLSDFWLGYFYNPRIGDVVTGQNIVSTGYYIVQFSIGDTISIVGGTDATNLTLIYWLQDNATPQSTTTTYNITTDLTNLTASGSITIDSDSTATVTLSANNGYHLPTSIIVTNADYTYNFTTGVINLSNATDNVIITASGLQIFTITTNLTNVTLSGHDMTIYQGERVVFNVIANNGYALPNTINVTGVSSFAFDKSDTPAQLILNGAYQNVIITATALNIYNITVTLDTGIYGTTTLQVIEGSAQADSLILNYTTFDNGVQSGYVFDFSINYNYNYNFDTFSYSYDYTNLFEDLTNYTVNYSYYEDLSITLTDISSDISFTINSTQCQSILNTFYLDYQYYLTTGYDMTIPLIYRPFTSNSTLFYRIYRDNYNDFVYQTPLTDSNNINLSVNVFTFLNGQYLPYSTYNYLLITFDDISNYTDISSYSPIRNYLPINDNFFKIYRLATQQDLERINAKNEQIIHIQENTSFLSLFSAILDAQFLTLKGLLNFNIFGINLFSILTLFISLSLVFLVIKFIRGGGHKKDE